MNNQISNIYINSLLADAAYIEAESIIEDKNPKIKKDGLSEDEIEKTLEYRMTEKPAEFIRENFEVIARHEAHDNLGSGFDAVIWKGRNGTPYENQLYISMRGTEIDGTIKDTMADLNLSVSAAEAQIIDMANWWKRISSDKDATVENINTIGVSVAKMYESISVTATGELFSTLRDSNIKIFVNGHSLGGHLATAFARLFGNQINIEQVSTFNSAGFASDKDFSTTNAFFNQVEKLLNLGDTQFKHTLQNNYFAEHGLSVATDNKYYLDQVGQRIPIYNEKSIAIPNHYMYKMTDTLALGNLLATLDNSLTLEKFNQILNSYPPSNGNTLENVLDAVRKIFFKEEVTPTQIGDTDKSAPSRVDFYTNLTNLQNQLLNPNEKTRPEDRLIGNVSIELFDTKILPNETNIETRYALKELNPFVLKGTGIDYSVWNQNGELDLYSIDNPNGMTEKYIEDRIKMLTWKNVFGSLNLNYTERLDELDFIEFEKLLEIAALSPSVALGVVAARVLRPTDTDGDWKFTDDASKLSLEIDGKNMTDLSTHHVLFGSEQHDKLNGDTLSDSLYGGSGDDTLDGKAGNDYMEGGVGYDTYHIDGKDTILDADMEGKVLLNGTKLAMFHQVNDNQWLSIDGISVANRVNQDLVINKDAQLVTIKDYFSLATEVSDNLWNGLDIWLASPEFKFLPNKKDKINQYTIVTPDSVIIDGSTKEDVILANNASQVIAKTGDRNDLVTGGYGADVIDGGAGTDVLTGSEPVASRDGSKDQDTLIGGDGRDILFGGDGDDVIHSGKRNEHLNQQVIDEFGDIAMGGAGNDTVYGGVRKDFLQGGEGKDTIFAGVGNDIVLGDAYIRPSNKSRSLTSSGSTAVKPVPFDGTSAITAGGELAVGVISSASLGADFRLDSTQTNPLTVKDLKGISIVTDNTSNWTFDVNQVTGDYTFSKTGTDLRRDFHLVDAQNGRDDGDFLHGGAGDDLIVGQHGDDFLYGDADNDILWGDDNRDKSVSGNDHLYGGAGDDTLYGGEGSDTLSGGEGSDTLSGGEGSDTLSGGVGFDTLDGGNGYDTYIFEKNELNELKADIIKDADHLGKIVVDNVILGELLWKLDPKTQTWVTTGQEISLKQLDDGSLAILNKDKIAFVVVEQFKNGALGIQLDSNQSTDEQPNNGGQTSNEAPKINHQIVSQNAIEAQAFEHQLGNHLFTDEDAANLKYVVTLADGSPLPSWLRFDANSLTLSGTPSKQDVGTLALKVTATDSEGLSNEQTWSFDITKQPNEAPTLKSDAVLPSSLKENAQQSISYASWFDDDNGVENLSFSLTMADGSALPSWVSHNGNQATLKPDFDAAGTYGLRLTATDADGLSQSMDWQLTVENQNRAPTVSGSVSEQKLTVGQDWQYQLPVSFSDLDKDETAQLNYHLAMTDGSAVPDWLKYDAQTQTLSGKADVLGSLNVNVIATDPHSETASLPISLLVADVIPTVPTTPNIPVTPVIPTTPPTTTVGVTKTGSYRNDTLKGTNGNDVLDGGNGNDILEGGKGNDRLIGGNGNDTYIFNLGDGQDRIKDTAGSDTLKMKGLNVDDLSFSRDGRHLTIKSLISDDRITIEDYYATPMPNNPINSFMPNFTLNNKNKINFFTFDNGKTLTYYQVDAMVHEQMQANHSIL